MRRFIAPLAVVAALGASAVPAHAEQVDIGVTVGDDYSATAYGRSDHPGETFGEFQIIRISATDSLSDPRLTVGQEGDSTMEGFPGSTTGAVTFIVNAHPIQGSEPEPFVFTSVVVCNRNAEGHVECQPGVGEQTLIALFP